MKKAIGFIGLGTMGAPMAANLLKNGYPVTVYNRTADKADALIRLGADAVTTAAEAARAADVLFTMVSDDVSLQEVFYGEEGIMSGIKPGLVIFDCSTVSPELSSRLHHDLAGHYVEFLDAPVTGSKPAAIDGTLVFMVGGKKDVLDEHKAILLTMGAAYHHMGEAGTGSRAKLAMNTIVGINVAALVEGMTIAAKSGINLDAFTEILLAGGAASRAAEMKSKRILNREFDPQFALKHMLKDLQLAEVQTAKLQLPTPLLQAAESMYRIGLGKGLGEQDLSAVAKCYEDWAGLQLTSGDAADKPASGKASTTVASNRRRDVRVPLNIKLQISIYQWQAEGSFSGQSLDAWLYDLSESGMQVVCDVPLATEMFVVIHFPKEAELPPITSKIIRIERHDDTFHYGCLISGMAPYTRIKLEGYIAKHLQKMA